jgi:hypothetical protein
MVKLPYGKINMFKEAVIGLTLRSEFRRHYHCH